MSLTPAEPLQPPPAPLVQAIQEHHETKAHPGRFDLRRDVFFAGNTRKDGKRRTRTTYDISLDPMRGDRYFCKHCPGEVFIPQPPPDTPARDQLLKQADPIGHQLRERARAEMTRAIEEAGGLGKAPMEEGASAARRSRPTTRAARREGAKHDLEHQERLDRFHDFLLAEYAELGTIPKALEALIALRENRPARYVEVIGDDALRALTTLQQYVWDATTPEERHAAKDRWLARRERQRAERHRRATENRPKP